MNDKWFWLNRLTDINDHKSNSSMPLTPQQFPERFELNDDYSCSESNTLYR